MAQLEGMELMPNGIKLKIPCGIVFTEDEIMRYPPEKLKAIGMELVKFQNAIKREILLELELICF